MTDKTCERAAGSFPLFQKRIYIIYMVSFLGMLWCTLQYAVTCSLGVGDRYLAESLPLMMGNNTIADHVITSSHCQWEFPVSYYGFGRNTQCSTTHIDTPRSQQQQSPPSMSSSVLHPNQFTVIINTWQRDKCLRQCIEHYLQCHNIAQIRIIWSEPDRAIDDSLRAFSTSHPDIAFFDEYRANKLTDRFRFRNDFFFRFINFIICIHFLFPLSFRSTSFP